jgi:hypothetical protein
MFLYLFLGFKGYIPVVFVDTIDDPIEIYKKQTLGHKKN